ncbi:Dabb family protein [Pelagibacterium montanilacus]|uniref:Dabb family protein n=1 Tax=Pelagibacterium montanilacus TaxID=2185280 RepID=UPI000F8EC0AA|nr:Dabb family protein [Pelagibacterium montanilacus]
MFRHMAILKFKDDADPNAIDAYMKAFPGFARSLPMIRTWYIGRNEGAGGESHVGRHGLRGNYDVGLVMEFDSPEEYRNYAESREHQSFFEEYCAPIFAERVVVQFHPS